MSCDIFQEEEEDEGVDDYYGAPSKSVDKYSAAIGKLVALEKSEDSLNWHGLLGSLDSPDKKAKLSGPEYKRRAMRDILSNAFTSERPITGEPSKKESILDTANRIINGERQDSYGAPEDSFQIIAEYWSTYLNGKFKKRTPDFKFVLDPVDVANIMVLLKEARKLGQNQNRDNYVDSVGYEAIAADRLIKWEDE